MHIKLFDKPSNTQALYSAVTDDKNRVRNKNILISQTHVSFSLLAKAYFHYLTCASYCPSFITAISLVFITNHFKMGAQRLKEAK